MNFGVHAVRLDSEIENKLYSVKGAYQDSIRVILPEKTRIRCPTLVKRPCICSHPFGTRHCKDD